MGKAKTKTASKSKPAAKAAKPKTHTIEGCKVIRHHKDGDSEQTFSNEQAARDYAATIK